MSESDASEKRDGPEIGESSMEETNGGHGGIAPSVAKRAYMVGMALIGFVIGLFAAWFVS